MKILSAGMIQVENGSKNVIKVSWLAEHFQNPLLKNTRPLSVLFPSHCTEKVVEIDQF